MDMGRGEERVSCMERVTWKLTLPSVNREPREFAVWLRKSKRGLGTNLEGVGWEGEGREVQKGGDICVHMADSC